MKNSWFWLSAAYVMVSMGGEVLGAPPKADGEGEVNNGLPKAVIPKPLLNGESTPANGTKPRDKDQELQAELLKKQIERRCINKTDKIYTVNPTEFDRLFKIIESTFKSQLDDLVKNKAQLFPSLFPIAVSLPQTQTLSLPSVQKTSPQQPEVASHIMVSNFLDTFTKLRTITSEKDWEEVVATTFGTAILKTMETLTQEGNRSFETLENQKNTANSVLPPTSAPPAAPPPPLAPPPPPPSVSSLAAPRTPAQAPKILSAQSSLLHNFAPTTQPTTITPISQNVSETQPYEELLELADKHFRNTTIPSMRMPNFMETVISSIKSRHSNANKTAEGKPLPPKNEDIEAAFSAFLESEFHKFLDQKNNTALSQSQFTVIISSQTNPTMTSVNKAETTEKTKVSRSQTSVTPAKKPVRSVTNKTSAPSVKPTIPARPDTFPRPTPQNPFSTLKPANTGENVEQRLSVATLRQQIANQLKSTSTVSPFVRGISKSNSFHYGTRKPSTSPKAEEIV